MIKRSDERADTEKVRKNVAKKFSSSCGSSSVVEHHLAKVGVASSSLVFRSIFPLKEEAIPQ